MVLLGFAVFKATDPLNPIGIGNVTLSKIEALTETGNVPGGEIEIPVLGQTKPYKIGIDFSSMQEDQFELMNPLGVDLIFRASAQSPLGSRKIKVVTHCFNTSNDLGKLDTGKKMDTKLEFTTHYLKIEVNGKVMFEHDKVSQVYIVNGIDYLAKLKADLCL